MAILKNLKKSYDIETIKNLLINPIKKSLNFQLVDDDLKIEGNNKTENEIQFIEKIEILRRLKKQ